MINMIILAFILALFIALLMESYKKFVRKNKSSKIENYIVAFVISALFGLVLYFLIPFHSLIPGANNSALAIIPYTIMLYLLQKPACMKLAKPMFKKLIERKMK